MGLRGQLFFAAALFGAEAAAQCFKVGAVFFEGGAAAFAFGLRGLVLPLALGRVGLMAVLADEAGNQGSEGGGGEDGGGEDEVVVVCGHGVKMRRVRPSETCFNFVEVSLSDGLGTVDIQLARRFFE